MSYLPSQNRRVQPLKPDDYDHEIILVDAINADDARRQSLDERRATSPSLASDSSSRRHSSDPLRKHASLRKELTKRKFGKYQDRHLDDPAYQTNPDTDGEDTDQQPQDTDPEHAEGENRGRMPIEPESEIDILYENQRGLFLCGSALFSSAALGNLDPPQWTTVYGKPSLTDTKNHQLPDPTWEWQWKDWKINYEDGVDEDGWEYSFAFSKKFSWHLPGCFNSFVRRRAWTRKRAKKGLGYKVQPSHMLNEDYFTIHPAQMRTHSRHSSVRERNSLDQRELEEITEKEDIKSIGGLLKALRNARIDREKMEAIENFIQNGGDELYYLSKYMHEIMRQFIFQASRRLLLSNLIKTLDSLSSQQSEVEASTESEKTSKQRKLQNLEEAVRHADEEVQRLEFWSDVKGMAENGETGGAVDKKQGWDDSWKGVDDSGPKDVISWRLPNADGCDDFHMEKGEAPSTSNGNGQLREQ